MKSLKSNASHIPRISHGGADCSAVFRWGKHLTVVVFTRNVTHLFRKRYWVRCWWCDLKIGPWKNREDCGYGILPDVQDLATFKSRVDIERMRTLQQATVPVPPVNPVIPEQPDPKENPEIARAEWDQIRRKYI